MRYIDDLVARYIKVLEQNHALDDTIVIVTGDHGEAFYEHDNCFHGNQLYEETIHVPLIIYNAKDACIHPDPEHDLVGHVDIAPTLLDLFKLPGYAGYQGRSLCNVDQSKVQNRVFFSSAQGLVNQDALITQNFGYSWDHSDATSRLFKIDSDPAELVDKLRAKRAIGQDETSLIPFVASRSPISRETRRYMKSIYLLT